MRINLITQNNNVKHIFKQVCDRLDIKLDTLGNDQIDNEFDMIIIEDMLWNDDDKILYEQYTRRIAIITQEIALYENKCDLLIHKPFLPIELMQILEEQINIVSDINNIIKPKANDTYDNEIDTIVQNISNNINEESDESIVHNVSTNNGGILDLGELAKIQDMLGDSVTPTTSIQNIAELQSNDDEQIDLANIIDQAINEAKDSQFDIKEPIKLILSQYSLKDVSSLLTKLDQNVIDALTQGQEVALSLKVK